jgi:hypothetical protein
MKDSGNAMKLKELLLQIVQGKKTISESSFDHYVTKITITQ